MGKDTSTKGIVVSLKLNVEKESKAGKTYQAHILKIDADGDEKTFIIGLKSPAAKFVEKLTKGQSVTVKQGGEYNSVQAVFLNKPKDSKGSSSYSKDSGYKYDPTGPIQGMILAAAVNAAINLPEGALNGKDWQEQIVSAAKAILLAKAKVDELVVQALKSKESDVDDSEEDVDDEDDAIPY